MLYWTEPKRGKHPHARGEDDFINAKQVEGEETPPRTWGRQIRNQPGNAPPRNTPTHVGKTTPSATPTCSRRKHPHARGEDLEGIIMVRGILETPPRTWGRLKQIEQNVHASGNTPTHVGKTDGDGRRCTHDEKHPHARGEDRSRPPLMRRCTETPPRTWGRPMRVVSR